MDFTQTRDGGNTAGVRRFVADDLLSIDVVPSRTGAFVTVSPTGEIDFVTAPVLRTALLSCLRAPCTEVIVSLDGVTFLNCAGLTVLEDAHHLAHAAGIALTLRGGSPAVLRPLRITSLWNQLSHRPSL